MDKLIDLQNIHFTYPNRHSVLKGVDFSLSTNERIVINGPNGAGKSTLFHLIVGLNKPTSGQVMVFGKERKVEADFKDVRRRIGLVFQDPDDQLFCPTVAEDIAFGVLNLGKPIDEAMAIVETTLQNLHLGHLRDRATHNLSGGEKRLVSLACVLAMEPEVLLLDEPTNALDEDTQTRLIEILNALPQAMVIISHDQHFRHQITTNRLNLEDGKLITPKPKCKHAK
ncbi:putative ABC transporter ATP-binding protein BruAb1_1365 [Candidatus Terasakiella magnetica]|uniref:Putative ABC transporter ATP-binding protein BruAb1_1365 n=1 Tax=Candidatus Terasakiella magnetica TaxID=1867952 RepID=A0A1C3RDZ6_9PROT|nr:ABC transporter ATP-binding protein [Candidatus Terasakiella magnetica]SCA55517.1 putative ABC transporter ATP-binding protein BruAb1_1365 [Candidatus Terasakiella magnetica]